MTPNDMGRRSPYDGEPYYCATCGLSLSEYGACDDVDCKLETKQQAEERRALREVLGNALKENNP